MSFEDFDAEAYAFVSRYAGEKKWRCAITFERVAIVRFEADANKTVLNFCPFLALSSDAVSSRYGSPEIDPLRAAPAHVGRRREEIPDLEAQLPAEFRDAVLQPGYR